MKSEQPTSWYPGGSTGVMIIDNCGHANHQRALACVRDVRNQRLNDRGDGLMRITHALFVAVSAVFALGTAQPNTQPTIAIAHGDVIDGNGGSPISNGVVVVRGSTIAAVGPFGTVDIPPEARIIDATGKSVLPGLADMHVHLTGGWDGEATEMLGFQRYLNALLYAGITTVLDTGNVLPYIQQIRQEISDHRLTGPAIHMAGPLIDGSDPIWPDISRAVASTAQFAALVKHLKQANVDVVKAYAGLSEMQLRALTKAAEAESLRVFVDAGPRNGTAVVAATGIAAFAHLGTSPVTDETVAMLRERKIASITTLAVYESFARRRLVDLAFLREPLVAETMPPQFSQEITSFAARPLSDDEKANAATALKQLQTAMANAKRLADAGILLAAGTDAPYPGDFYGEGLHRELELLVEAGFTPLQALSAATKNAAALLNQEHQWGTLAVDRRADIVIVNGHPARAITETRNIDLVIQSGRIIDRAALRFNPARDLGFKTVGSN
jgi:imidazolonepropionase-like amidohydrolase